MRRISIRQKIPILKGTFHGNLMWFNMAVITNRPSSNPLIMPESITNIRRSRPLRTMDMEELRKKVKNMKHLKHVLEQEILLLAIE